MEAMKNNIRKIFWVFFSLFLLLILFLGKFVLIDASDLMSNSYNPRLRMIDQSFPRGDILDKNDNIIATSKLSEDGNSYYREYPYGEILAPVIGFTSVGGSAMELSYGTTLQTLNMEIFQRASEVFLDSSLKGNSLKLTIDMELEELCYEALKDYKGAIVALEPSTGKVLAMTSTPTYDPEMISINWNDIKNDTDSPLVNRSTYGLYPPGSVFKIVTTLAMMRNMENWSTYTYNCLGTETFGGKVLQCYGQTAHGEQTVFDAFTVSCNTFFATVVDEMGDVRLRETAESLYFNEKIQFSLGLDKSVFTMAESDGTKTGTVQTTQDELVETAIGQGETLVTPLHLAMITASIANDGVMMKPYIVSNILDKNGKSIDATMPEMLDNIMTIEETKALNDMMNNVVNYGTAKTAKLDNFEMSAKTGTAETNSGDDHGLIVAFAPSENPKIAIAMIYENSDGSKATLSDVKNIMTNYLENN